ncbi:Fork-head transcriptional regulator 2 [Golovinomyces cichoracearum]|uniref:Fork-head transcriptional regulator 2 n=1 Tax=Golovinomyces cichoracearum TaxID=62708 RepID=A0A420IYE8_9PEZI|nr:Fork-head transcriptional regulator 2 [Golovinomyces cichoracearum]
MPTASKRPQRNRREVVRAKEVPDSSPYRPTKRRKKVEEHVNNDEMEPTKLPIDREGIPMCDEELISAIAPTLLLPTYTVQATHDHANALHEKHSKQGVQAYAKLAGKDWTFYVKRLKNNIGRPPEGSVSFNAAADSNDTIDDSYQDDNTVHVDLGPSKTISRTHAEISFDSDTELWKIIVHGRNGIKLNNRILKRGETASLVSGEVIEIGGVEMMFVLPQENGCLKIDNFYLHRAGLISTPQNRSEENPKEEPINTESVSTSNTSSSSTVQIAPAPPEYQRPGTPVNSNTKGSYPPGKNTPGGIAGNTMFMNTDDIDLSLDSNQHIKPSYSYSQLISQAILDTDDQKLTLNGIYTFIQDKFAYYRHQLGGGWQNSIRHNLSLNKAFEKVARDTNEPGKGMKWHIKDDHRDEMVRLALRGGRGGHRGSPGSPGILARGNRSTFSSATRRQKRSPRLGSPPQNSYPSNISHFTPDRGAKLNEILQDELPNDGSPLPRHCRSYGLTDNLTGSPPVLSSSYMPEDTTSFVTPAPHRVHPRLAPPSTAQRPSQHMPTSSPAPFWKYAGIGNTPLMGATFDSSPVKGHSLQAAASSSPVPVGSPTRKNGGNSSARNLGLSGVSTNEEEIDEDDDQGIDLTRGFQSIGSYHAPINIGVSVGTPINRR